MKKLFLLSLIGILMFSCKFYPAGERSEELNEEINEAYEGDRWERSKKCSFINIDKIKKFAEPQLIIDGKFFYMFIREDGKYRLQKITDYNPNGLVIELNDVEEEILNLDLGDDRIYFLSYNPDNEEYRLTKDDEWE